MSERSLPAFHASYVVRADEVREGDGLIGGSHFPGDEPRPYLVTRAVRHGNDRTMRRLEVGFRELVVPNDALLVVQRPTS